MEDNPLWARVCYGSVGDAVGMLCGTLYGTQIWYVGVLGMFVLGKSLVGKNTVSAI